MKILQIENITAAELLEMLSNKHKPKGEREDILEPVFPFKNRPGTCRFRIFNKGYMGRKSKS